METRNQRLRAIAQGYVLDAIDEMIADGWGTDFGDEYPIILQELRAIRERVKLAPKTLDTKEQ